MNKQLLTVEIAVLLLTIGLSGCLESSKSQNIEVTFTDLYYKQSEYGDGRTLSMNVTFRNSGKEQEYVSMPLIITNKERELNCDFVTVDEGIESTSTCIIIPPNFSVNATVSTWDSANACECLSTDEKPKTFEYQLGSGVTFQPTIIQKYIPDYLINS